MIAMMKPTKSMPNECMSDTYAKAVLAFVRPLKSVLCYITRLASVADKACSALAIRAPVLVSCQLNLFRIQLIYQRQVLRS